MFRFEAMWLQEERCVEVVKNSWKEGMGRACADLMTNVGHCGAALSMWSDKEFGNIPKEVVKCKNELARLQPALQTTDNIQAAQSSENKIAVFFRKKDVFWLQLSWVSWMREGDMNSKFFHRVAPGRKKWNFIEEVVDGAGVVHMDEWEIQEGFCRHFSELFMAKS